VFATDGYDEASIRSIARAAAVDPALVHHYFGGKAELFMAALELPRDPRDVAETLDEGLPTGQRVVVGFLRMWDVDPADREPGRGHPFVAAMQAASATEGAGIALREFLTERIWSRLPRLEGDSETMYKLRRALVSSQLMGLAWSRYILQMEPLASAPPEVIARVVGPTMERYAIGDLSDFEAG
jgi:AcrR family transcriptional regulator